MRSLLASLSAAAATLALLVLGAPAHAACSVELNSASSAQLETLPGIGPAKAAAILDYRTTAGPFTTVDQLDNVTGIGPATLENVRPFVCVGEAGPAAEAPSSTASSSTASSSTASSSTASSSAGAIDINTASAAQLEGLPGIGPSKSAAIIAERTENGPFSSCNDLTRVLGIGEATIAKLAATCTASQP